VSSADIPLLHIGFYKAASTWLQKIMFTPDYGYEHVLDIFSLHSLLVDPEQEKFDPARVADVLADKRKAIADRGHVPVFSSEALCGDLLRKGYNRWQNADRLKQVVSRARVLLVVREQRDLIRSMYKTMVMWGMAYPVDSLLRTGPGPSLPRFDMEFIRFHSLAEYYAFLYGEDAVLVLPYELFRRNPADFLGYIYSHTGRAAPTDSLLRDLPLKQVLNPGQSLTYIHLQRWINRLTMTGFRDYAGLFNNNSIDRIFRRIAWHRKHARDTWLDPYLERKFATQVSARLEGKMADSNIRLQAFCPVELGSFAYEL
jgi:hypothetical protein